MTEQTLSGVLVKSRTPGQRGGTTYTITDKNRTKSVTWIDYESFHVGDPEYLKNVTVHLSMDMSRAEPISSEGMVR